MTVPAHSFCQIFLPIVVFCFSVSCSIFTDDAADELTNDVQSNAAEQQRMEEMFIGFVQFFLK